MGIELDDANNAIDVAPGALTSTGTVLPFSAISGAVSVIPASLVSAPPVMAMIASSVKLANAGSPTSVAVANEADPKISILRRVKAMFLTSPKLEFILF